ncbi:MAG TPA: TonB family protein [Fontimonas sp.]
MPDQGKPESGLQRLATTLGRSAEYSIALGLIVVCLVVGGALWLLDGDSGTDNVAVSTPAAVLDSAGFEDEEKAALEGWNQQLQGDFKQIEQTQKRNAEEAAQRERQRQDADRLQRAERAAAELERQQRAQAAAPTVEPRRTAAPTVAVAPTREPAKAAAVRVEPRIDWNSCRRPVYPDSSVKRREEGTVTVEVDLNAAGKVLAGRIAQSSGFAKLDTAAQRAIEKCSFSPATVDGQPQAATAQVRFGWKLE